MKKLLLNIVILFFLYGCTNNTSDCLSPSGAIVNKTISLTNFSKVIIHESIEIELKQGSENSIQIYYGKNLIDNISTIVKNELLSIDNSTCNLIRDNNPAKIVLTAIDISEIRNSSQFSVFNKEIIKFSSLTLISENYNEDYVNVGDFNLLIDNKDLNIISNNVSNFTITGNTENLFIGFYAGVGKFNGENLMAQNVNLFHRGINEIIVSPTQQLTGEIRSSGNVISVNKPPIIKVKEFYSGKLIFK